MSGGVKINSLPKPHGEHILVKREEPEEEIPVAKILVNRYKKRNKEGEK